MRRRPRAWAGAAGMPAGAFPNLPLALSPAMTLYPFETLRAERCASLGCRHWPACASPVPRLAYLYEGEDAYERPYPQPP